MRRISDNTTASTAFTSSDAQTSGAIAVAPAQALSNEQPDRFEAALSPLQPSGGALVSAVAPPRVDVTTSPQHHPTLTSRQEKLIEAALTCKTTGKIFEEPVFLFRTGYTSDKSVLQGNFRIGPAQKKSSDAVPDYMLRGLCQLWSKRQEMSAPKLFSSLEVYLECAFTLEMCQKPFLTGSGFTYSAGPLIQFVRDASTQSPLGRRDEPVGYRHGALNVRVMRVVAAMEQTVRHNNASEGVSSEVGDGATTPRLAPWHQTGDFGAVLKDAIRNCVLRGHVQNSLFDMSSLKDVLPITQLRQRFKNLDSKLIRMGDKYGVPPPQADKAEQRDPSDHLARVIACEDLIRDIAGSIRHVFDRASFVELDRVLLLVDSLILQAIWRSHRDYFFRYGDELGQKLAVFDEPSVNARIAFLWLQGKLAKQRDPLTLDRAKERIEALRFCWEKPYAGGIPGARVGDFWLGNVAYFDFRRLETIRATSSSARRRAAAAFFSRPVDSIKYASLTRADALILGSDSDEEHVGEL